MNFKRGIFCGIMIMIGSVSNIYEMYRLKNIAACWIFVFTLLMGVIQFIVSFGYKDQLKKRILLLCFGTEGIYCAISVIGLLLGNADSEIKIFGMVVVIVYFIVIFTSIHALYGNK